MGILVETAQFIFISISLDAPSAHRLSLLSLTLSAPHNCIMAYHGGGGGGYGSRDSYGGGGGGYRYVNLVFYPFFLGLRDGELGVLVSTLPRPSTPTLTSHLKTCAL